MDKELHAKIEEFKSYRIDKPPLEIIEHYKEELRAMQDALDIISGRWKMQIIALLCNGEFKIHLYRVFINMRLVPSLYKYCIST